MLYSFYGPLHSPDIAVSFCIGEFCLIGWGKQDNDHWKRVEKLGWAKNFAYEDVEMYMIFSKYTKRFFYFILAAVPTACQV